MESKVFIYPTRKETKGLVAYSRHLARKDKPINGNIKALIFLIYDYVRTCLMAREVGYKYATYRIWWFKTEQEREKFKSKHKI